VVEGECVFSLYHLGAFGFTDPLLLLFRKSTILKALAHLIVYQGEILLHGE
jgi:hypothetical protein